MKAYSLDLRRRVLEAALSREHTIAEIAALFGVGTTFVNKMLRSEVRRRNDVTLSELRSHLADHAQVEVSIPTKVLSCQ